MGTWQRQDTTNCDLAGHSCWVLGTVSRRTHHAINHSYKKAVRALLLSLRSHMMARNLCRGVVWDEDSQRWVLCLSPGERALEKQQGLFKCGEAAASAYNTLAIELLEPSNKTALLNALHDIVPSVQGCSVG